MSDKIKFNIDELSDIFNPISRYLAKSMHDTYDTEMDTGDYSPKDALYHAIDGAIYEVRYSYDVDKNIADEELYDKLELLYYATLGL